MHIANTVCTVMHIQYTPCIHTIAYNLNVIHFVCDTLVMVMHLDVHFWYAYLYIRKVVVDVRVCLCLIKRDVKVKRAIREQVAFQALV